MSTTWQVRQEGTDAATVVETANDVLAGLRDGVWQGSDEVRGPGDPRWTAIEAHPTFEEAAAELEAPPQEEADETTLDMNPLIDVCLVLLIFFILTITYESLKRAIDLPADIPDKPGQVQKLEWKDVKDRIFLVVLRMDGDNPVIKVQDKVVPVEKVQDAIRDVVTSTGRSEMLFDVDGDVPWGVQTAVLDAAKGNKIANILYKPRAKR
jgi:biopolymer transport protein ExbD